MPYFVGAIADTYRCHLKEEVVNSPFFSVMLDSSADVALRENTNFYLRYIDSRFNKAHTLFFCIHEMTGGKAEDYEAAVDEVLTSVMEDWRSKMVGLATDGPNVMRGTRSGLAVRLERQVDGLVTVHCVAHDLHRCVLDACKELDYLKLKFEPTLKKLFSHYHFSPKRQRNLRTHANDLHIQLH